MSPLEPGDAVECAVFVRGGSFVGADEGEGPRSTLAQDLRAGRDVGDAAGVKSPDALAEEFRPLKEEGAFFPEAELEPGEVHLLLVGFDGGEVRIQRPGEVHPPR